MEIGKIITNKIKFRIDPNIFLNFSKKSASTCLDHLKRRNTKIIHNKI